VLATVLLSRYWALNCPDELDERLAFTAELDGLVDVDGSPELWLQAGKCRLHVLAEVGDLAAAIELSQRLAVVAARLNYREHVRLAMAFDATVAGLQGRFEDAAGLTAAAQALMAQRGYPAHAALAAFVQQVPVLWLRGGLGQALPACRAVVERDPSRPALRAVLSWVAAEAGEIDEARAQLEAVDVGRFVAGEPAVDWWAALAACANAARIVGDVDRAAIVHRALLPYADRNAVFGQVAFYGAVAHHLGVLSLLMGDDSAAVGHLERALERHEAMAAEPFVALTAAELSAALVHSGAGERAEGLRERAATITARLGLGLVAGRLAVSGRVGA
jgi:tetratricopeptide (TPR) repeat protein